MTPKEALKLVKSGNPVGVQVPLYHLALDIMENLIAKAEPMKPVEIRGYRIGDRIGICPKCRYETFDNEYYCAYCGQKLDWSDEK